MGNTKDDRGRINVTFDIDTYNQIKAIADKNKLSMSEVVRDWALQGLNGTLTQKNLDVLVPIIRDQLKSIIDPAVNRLATLSVKTCIQAGASAYLSAEALHSFVPEERSEDFLISYENARKKAVAYAKSKSDID